MKDSWLSQFTLEEEEDEAEVAHDFNGFFTFVACGLDPRPSELQVTQTRIQCPAVSMMFAPVLEKELTEII
ncbi:hypothetical protein J6590_101028 [Homalodisca vitripennis]|nr:hypothetical protein J6590_101028 [Homalodisca vitripennis]